MFLLLLKIYIETLNKIVELNKMVEFAHPASRNTCSMLVYLFIIACLFSISSYYMYKRTTSVTEGEVVGVKLV